MVKSPQPPAILDRHGRAIARTSGKSRQGLGELFASQFSEMQNRRKIAATYDAAGSSDDFKNYWAPADALDADSANSFAVRNTLVKRSRYDVANNGYSDGIAQTYATDLIGIGPTLRMQTGSDGFNRMVELAWFNWCKEIQFRRKLWCLAHAKHQDGEGLGVIRRNGKLKHRVKLDWVLHETEQCQSPWLPYGEAGRIDGMQFDEFGNPEWYEFVTYHPGSNLTGLNAFGKSEKIPAKFVSHWFKMRRPGQHRGIPACTSTLNLGAASRRYREATVQAAENIANVTLLLATAFPPDEMDTVSPMSTLDIAKGMMIGMPQGYDMRQPKAEQPTSTHKEFVGSLVSEQARPISMPLNKAKCDSSSYNYASGRLDHQTYYGHLDVDREDCNDCVLDPIFAVWFDQAVMTYGWLGGNPDALSEGVRAHIWDWPKHQVADIGTEADAADKKLKNGSSSIAAEHIASGLDPEDELQKEADFYSISIDQMKMIKLIQNMPQHVIPYVATMFKLEPNVKPDPSEQPPAQQPQETPSNG